MARTRFACAVAVPGQTIVPGKQQQGHLHNVCMAAGDEAGGQGRARGQGEGKSAAADRRQAQRCPQRSPQCWPQWQKAEAQAENKVSQQQLLVMTFHPAPS